MTSERGTEGLLRNGAARRHVVGSPQMNTLARTLSLKYSRPAGAGREEGPERLAGVAAGEVQAHVGEQLPHPPADLEQAQPEGVELEARGPGGGQPAAERVQEPAGGGVEEHAELVGDEAVVG